MMYKKMLGTLAITATLIANPLFASNFFHKFTAAKATKTNNATLKTNAKNVADFSGTWEGRCDEDDFVETITIKNTANKLTLEGIDLSIGTLETISSTSEESTFINHLLLEWNEDNSKLLINGAFVDYISKPDPIMTSTFGDMRGSFSLVGGQLVMEFNSHISSGESDVSVCTYHRK